MIFSVKLACVVVAFYVRRRLLDFVVLRSFRCSVLLRSSQHLVRLARLLSTMKDVSKKRTFNSNNLTMDYSITIILIQLYPV